jgi:hypothetical protein
MELHLFYCQQAIKVCGCGQSGQVRVGKGSDVGLACHSASLLANEGFIDSNTVCLSVTHAGTWLKGADSESWGWGKLSR